MWSPCYTPSWGCQNAHIGQNNILFNFRNLWNIRPSIDHPESGVTWTWFMHLDLRRALWVSLQQNQPQHQFWIIFPLRSSKGDQKIYCYHIVHITPISYAYQYILVCQGRAYLLCKTAWKERTEKTTTEHKTVPGTHTGAKRRNAPKSTTPPSQSVSRALTHTHNHLCREQARLNLTKQPHLVGMTTGLHNLICQTLGDGSRDYCFHWNMCMSSIYYQAELEFPTSKKKVWFLV